MVAGNAPGRRERPPSLVSNVWKNVSPALEWRPGQLETSGRARWKALVIWHNPCSLLDQPSRLLPVVKPPGSRAKAAWFSARGSAAARASDSVESSLESAFHFVQSLFSIRSAISTFSGSPGPKRPKNGPKKNPRPPRERAGTGLSSKANRLKIGSGTAAPGPKTWAPNRRFDPAARGLCRRGIDELVVGGERARPGLSNNANRSKIGARTAILETGRPQLLEKVQ